MKLVNAEEKVDPLEIIFDWNLYPRHEANSRIDHTNLKRIRDAIQAAIKLPYPVVATDWRVIDGVHRLKAHLMEKEGEPITIERWKYDNEAEMVLDAARRNVSHGLPLGPKDRVHVFLKLRKMKAPLPVIAQALGMSEENLAFLVKRRTATTSSGEKIPLSHGAEVLSDGLRTTKRLNAEEEHFARTASGILPIVNAHLLLNALRALTPKDCPEHEFAVLLSIREEIDRWESERGNAT